MTRRTATLIEAAGALALLLAVAALAWSAQERSEARRYDPRYPRIMYASIIDPTPVAPTPLHATEPGTGFGVSIAVDGEHALVGAPLEVSDGAVTGVVHTYRFDGAAWVEGPVLTPPDGGTGQFGFAVALDGTTAIIGAYLDGEIGPGAGAAYVFEWQGGAWEPVVKLLGIESGGGARFGSSVAVSGDRAVIGSHLDRERGLFAGAAYVFERQDGVWTLVSKLLAEDARGNDLFGWAVDVSGDLIIVGAYQYGNEFPFTGAAYVYAPGERGWREVGFLEPSDLAADDRFGVSVAIDAGRALVGSWMANAVGQDSGAAYVFEPNTDGEWVETAKLIASDAAPGARFGLSVALKGDAALIGAYREGGVAEQAGAAYGFRFEDGGWIETAKLSPGEALAGHNFGYAVALSPEHALVSAWTGQTAPAQPDAVYAYQR